MTETTQETIKFARSWLENAEKYGDPNAPTTGTMTALARAVMELAEKIKNERDKHIEDATFMAKMINGKTKKISRLEADLAALKEKYRWRKQSEEPAPMGKDVEVYSPIQERAFCYFSPRIVPSYWYWRPLNLPEEETK